MHIDMVFKQSSFTHLPNALSGINPLTPKQNNCHLKIKFNKLFNYFNYFLIFLFFKHNPL